MSSTRLAVWTLLALASAASASGVRPAQSQQSIILATTTSMRDSGLLDVLVPWFETQTGIALKVIAVGSGAALRMASTGNADVVLVHSPAAEKEYVARGDLIEGRRVMHNDFVIVGPPGDPAGVATSRTVADAMRVIAGRGIFVSRGDGSGTHAQELALWTSARIDVRALGRREETGQGMGATLTVADQRKAYTLTDRGTYLALRKRLRLVILFQGNSALHNVYHVYVVNPDRHGLTNAAGARAFASFLVSSPVQHAIGRFRRKELGEPLFVPDALPDGGQS